MDAELAKLLVDTCYTLGESQGALCGVSSELRDRHARVCVEVADKCRSTCDHITEWMEQNSD